MKWSAHCTDRRGDSEALMKDADVWLIVWNQPERETEKPTKSLKMRSSSTAKRSQKYGRCVRACLSVCCVDRFNTPVFRRVDNRKVVKMNWKTEKKRNCVLSRQLSSDHLDSSRPAPLFFKWQQFFIPRSCNSDIILHDSTTRECSTRRLFSLTYWEIFCFAICVFVLFSSPLQQTGDFKNYDKYMSLRFVF